MNNLPLSLLVVFFLTIAFLFFMLSISLVKTNMVKKKKITVIISLLMIWLLIQAILAISGIYWENRESIPPLIILTGIIPSIIVLFFLFFRKPFSEVIIKLPLKQLTLIHLARIPIEFILFKLFTKGLIPIEMTFQGYNYDIFIGLSSAILFILYLTNFKYKNHLLFTWNIIGIIFLINIIILSILATPSPFQQYAFSQPNVVIFHFPLIWLPTFIVPIILFAHISSIKSLSIHLFNV